MIEIGIDPIAFGHVRWYGIMIALAVLVAILWTIREVRREGKVSSDTVLTVALVGVPAGIIFSRLLHVVDLWDYYGQNLGEIIGGSGLSIYGGIIGGALAIWIYSRFSKLQYGYLADIVAPGLILAQAVGRIGCTINGCCAGIATSLPWGIVYTHPDSYALGAGPTHPVTVYEIIYNLIVFGVLLKLRGRLKPDGSLFLVYLGLYSLWRLASDPLRIGTPFLFGLHQAQVIAIIVLAISVPLLVYRTRWVKKEPKPD